MRFLWLDNEGPVIYTGTKHGELKGIEGTVIEFPFKNPGSRLVKVDFKGKEMEIPAELLLRTKHEQNVRIHEVSESVTALLWEGFENNSNAYVIRGEGDKWILIDPGHLGQLGSVLGALHQMELPLDTATAVLFTHSHPDHFESVPVFSDLNIPIGIGEKELEYHTNQGRMLYLMFQGQAPEVKIDISMKDGKLDLEGFNIKVIHTPGHTPGHVCLLHLDEKVLITGDLIFDQGVGRTDFPGGSTKQLFESITEAEKYDVEHICPGHGPSVSGKTAVQKNYRVIKGYASYM